MIRKKYQKQGVPWVLDDKGENMPEHVYRQKHGHDQCPTQSQPGHNRERVQIRSQTQANLQRTDDNKEKLICALERFEAVSDDVRPERSAIRQNFHLHPNEVPESVLDAEQEVVLQIKAFSHVVAPVRGNKKTISWLLKDFLCWLGGRERISPQLGKTDQYAIPVIQCILGERFHLPEIFPQSSPHEISGEEILDNAFVIGQGLEKDDEMKRDFAQNPDKQATQHTHSRGTLQEGEMRINKIAQAFGEERWLSRFFNENWVNIKNVR